MKKPTKNELLRQLPKIDELQRLVFSQIEATKFPHSLLTDAIREVTATLRAQVVNEERFNMPSFDELVKEVFSLTSSYLQCNLKPVINATGIVLHTNLGRAPMSKRVAENIKKVAEGYSTLEYNINNGKRGSRHEVILGLVQRLAGAESAVIVNNNAAAVMLILKALCENKEVIVSRGELVEIGGSFRVPDVMTQSGALLREVGTTNKTRVSDYEKAITTNTGALLKVHTSNFKIVGFTEETTLDELVALGKKHGIPTIYDFGSGLMTESADEVGIADEETVKTAFSSGIDLIAFSGDKLLGSSQSGIIAGKKELVDKIKSHPLTRILRVDKLGLAALEATLRIYLCSETAKKEIPTLRMLSYSQDELKKKAQKILKALKPILTDDFTASVEKMEGQVGGGSAPGQLLSSYGVEITPLKISINELEEKLRLSTPPIIARIKKDKLLLDSRTIDEEQFSVVANIFKNIAMEDNAND
ncbi:MAG: L-seryl-tRNA(Sec) selenium transferase [Firmicutes bacterium]|nr:L-seryl-tRNA(Sec) selenium transferase [Bacillota bacterium]